MILRKITTGFVIQYWDTKKGCFTEQEFVGIYQCEYETEDGEPIFEEDHLDLYDAYLPFDMVQPKKQTGV